MNRAAVQSRDIAIVGYDGETATLEVTFRGGGVYRYNNVPERTYVDLMTSGSHGIYFNRNIKEKFSYAKVR